MRIVAILTTVSVLTLLACVGCDAPAKQEPVATQTPDHRPVAQAPTPAAPKPRPAAPKGANPTALSGRGEPSLDDQFRPAAWVYIDGQAGRYIDEEGSPRVQWIIEEPVGESPTFRVEAFEPLLGRPDAFACVVYTLETAGGPAVSYSFRADAGSFEVGREYSLLNPGANFGVRNLMTGDDVIELPPLPPGKYALVAGVKNEGTASEALAVTHFTVGK